MSAAKYTPYRNTPEEEEAINRGIAMDPDTFEPSEEFFAGMRPFMDRFKNKTSTEQPEAPR